MEIINFGLFFCHLTPPPLITQKIKILKIWKKPERYCHFIHEYHKWSTINENHMIMIPEILITTDRIYSHFGPFFALFTPPPPNKPKNQNLKQWKKHLQISSFYTRVPYITIIWYVFPEIWSATDRLSFHLGPFFALLLP